MIRGVSRALLFYIVIISQDYQDIINLNAWKNTTKYFRQK